MPTFRLNYEPARISAGIPWGLEFPNGERRYFARVEFRVPAWTVLIPGEPRQHGYLECAGCLYVDGDTAIVEEDDGSKES